MTKVKGKPVKIGETPILNNSELKRVAVVVLCHPEYGNEASERCPKHHKIPNKQIAQNFMSYHFFDPLALIFLESD